MESPAAYGGALELLPRHVAARLIPLSERAKRLREEERTARLSARATWETRSSDPVRTRAPQHGRFAPHRRGGDACAAPQARMAPPPGYPWLGTAKGRFK